MRPFTAFPALVLLGACQEYGIGQPPPDYGDPNPIDLASPVNIDKIVQVTTPSVDVLWAVDNSGSMFDEQQALAQNFQSFMDYFLGSGLDYHIGVVSTDMASNQHKGKLAAAADGTLFITPDTQAPLTVFAQMAQLGTLGSSDERGREAVYAALELLKNSHNDGFLRKDDGAGVHVVVISDEQDYSDNSIISRDEFVDYLNNLRPNGELVTFNSIVNPPGPTSFQESPGTDYLYVSDRVGGIKYPIHSGDWLTVLEQLGIQAAGLKREYFLSQLPVETTIAVQVVKPDGNVIAFDTKEFEYSAARNSITFDVFIPEPLSSVYIQYTILSSLVDNEDEAAVN